MAVVHPFLTQVECDDLGTGVMALNVDAELKGHQMRCA